MVRTPLVRCKIVTGYRCAAGVTTPIKLARERGEVEGHGSNPWSDWKVTRPDWVRDKKIIPLMQMSLEKHHDLPDVPLLLDLATEMLSCCPEEVGAILKAQVEERDAALAWRTADGHRRVLAEQPTAMQCISHATCGSRIGERQDHVDSRPTTAGSRGHSEPPSLSHVWAGPRACSVRGAEGAN
jgi:hypothetical protein